MAISLNWVLAGIICVVVLAVAGATLGITMAVSLDALTSVGSERALSLTTDVSDLSSAYLNVLAFDATSTRDVATMLGALPSDLAARGTNWTALYGSSMFTSLSDSNFTLFRSKILFDDGNWMQLLSRCAATPANTCTAWWEVVGASAWAIGGRSLSRATFTDSQPAGSLPEEAGFPIDPNPWNNARAAAIRSSTNKMKSCSWEGLKYYHTVATGGLWVLTAGCNLVNSSGVYLGRVQYEAFVDRDLDRFLETVERSPNSVLFIVDSELRVVATTQKTSHFTDASTTGSAAVPAGCSTNADTDIQGTNLRLGCLVKASEFPFKPLQAQSSAFLNTSGKSLQTVKIDGESYYTVSERINSNLPGFSFNVILFSPESDVIGDVERGRNIAIGVTAGVFLIGAAIAMLVTTKLLQALTNVSEKLYKMAKLDDDSSSNKDGQNQQQQGGNNNNGNQRNAEGNYLPSREMSEMDGQNNHDGNNNRVGATQSGVHQNPSSLHREGSSFDNEGGLMRNQSSFNNDASGYPRGANGGNGGGGSSGAMQLQDQSVVSEFAALQSAYFAMNTAMKNFTKYVPKDVVRELMAKKELCTINMEPLRCTMLFCDISNFTSICERVDPSSISELIRLYFERMSGIVTQHDGIIDKFIADCIMTIWGAPSLIDHQELRGSLCALALQRESRRDPLDSAFRAVDEGLSIRVGVASGTVHAGNMGSDKRMSYTVIGDAVNHAARLLSFNRQWSTSTMIPEELHPYVSQFIVTRKLIFAAIVGKDVPSDIYELIGMQEFPDANIRSVISAKLDEQERRLNGNGNNNNKPSSAAASSSPVTPGAGDENNNNNNKNQPRKKANTHSVAKLIEDHQKQGFATREELLFASTFSRAADELKKQNYDRCIETLACIEHDHKSIAKLREIALDAKEKSAQGTLPATSLYNDFFVFRASEK